MFFLHKTCEVYKKSLFYYQHQHTGLKHSIWPKCVSYLFQGEEEDNSIYFFDIQNSTQSVKPAN